MIITITGTPGTGKSVVARKLAKKLGYEHVDLNKLIKEDKLYVDKDKGTLIVSIPKLRRFMAGFIAGKDNLIIDSHLSHFLSADYCMVLRCRPDELEKRLKKKKWAKNKILENVRAEVLDVILVEVLREHGRKRIKHVLEIDTTGKSPKQIIRNIALLLKKQKSHFAHVKWLKKYWDKWF